MTTPRRIAVIDIGTNTLLLLVAEIAGDALRPIHEVCRYGRLGQGLDTSGRLHDDAIARSLDIAREYRAAIDELGVAPADIAVVGTQALREAANARAFTDPAVAILGAPIEIIAGEREAQLVHLAVSRSFPELADSAFVVIDVGGGSTEFVVSEPGGVRGMTSVPIGSVRMTERHLASDPPTPAEVTAMIAGIDRALDEALSRLEIPAGHALVGTAGTATTLAAVELRMADYDPERIQGTRLARSVVDRQLARYLELSTAERSALPGLEPARADVICAGAAIISRAMAYLDAPEIRISDRGVRWGVAYELRDRAPI